MPQIIPLPEGEFTIGHDKVFVPFNPEKDVLTDRPTGALLVEVQPFLVITKTDVLLLDTGLGFNQDGRPQLHENLRRQGISPESVTKVLLSHLHKDHAGGVMHEDTQGVLKGALPNAVYYVFRAEAEFALQTGFPAYYTAQLEPLFASGQVEWLDGESGDIGGNIRWQHSGGHCPGHIVYWIEEDGDTIFFGGDEAPQLKQVLMRYVAKYDYDGKKAAQLRAQWAKEGQEAGWQFLFYHDVKKPLARL